MDGDDDITVAMSNCYEDAKSNEGTASISDDDSLTTEDNTLPTYPSYITGNPTRVPEQPSVSRQQQAVPIQLSGTMRTRAVAWKNIINFV